MQKTIKFIILLFTITLLSSCGEKEEPNSEPYIDGSSYLIFEIGTDKPQWSDYIGAYDSEDGEISIFSRDIDDSAVDMNTVGDYEIYISIFDSGGLEATFTLTVQIIDSRVVNIELTGEEIIELEVHDEYIELGATAVFDSGEYLDITIIGSVDTSVIGEYILEYSVDDRDVSVFRKVVVVDTTVPTLDFGDYQYVYLYIGTEYSEFDYLVNDNYYADEELEVSVKGSVLHNAVGTYELRYTVTDPSNNESLEYKRFVVVVDGDLPQLFMSGEADMTIEYGDKYVEYNAVLLTAEGMLIANRDGIVDYTVLGDYYVEYTFNGSDLVVSRDVHIVDTTAPVVTLLGEPSLVLPRNSEYTEEGVTASDLYDGVVEYEILSSDLDLSTVGTYEIVYTSTDSNGNTNSTVKRTVTVIYNDPTVTDIVIDGTYEKGLIDFTLNDIDMILVSSRVVINEESSQVDSQVALVGVNSVVVDNLQSSTTYSITIYGTYDLEDGNSEKEYIIYEGTFSTREKVTPSFILNTTSPDENIFTFSFDFIDPDNFIEEAYVVLYEGGNEVGRQLAYNDKTLYTFTGLNNDTDYNVEIELTYNMDDGNGIISSSTKLLETFSTLPVAPEVVSFFAEDDNIKYGEQLSFVVQLNNPSDVDIIGVIVNGNEILVEDLATSNYAVFSSPYGEDAGDVTFTLEGIIVRYNNQESTYELSNPKSVIVNVFKEIKIIGFEAANGEFVLPEGPEIFTITFDNPAGYDIKEISIWGNTYYPEDFMNVTENSIDVEFYIHSDGGSNGSLVTRYINMVRYGDDDFTETIGEEWYELFPSYNYVFRDFSVSYISTVNDLKNIQQDGYYELTNDIDLSGLNWDPIEDFRGYLNGNGYSIKNLSILAVLNDQENNSFGLFDECQCYIENLNIEDGFISLIGLDGVNANSRTGLLAGHSYNSYFENISVSGSIDSVNSREVIIGGLTGDSSRTIFKGVTTDVDFNVSITEGYSIIIGGLSGHVDQSSIDEISINGKISLSKSLESWAWDIRLGGISSHVYNSSLKNSIVNIELEISNNSDEDNMEIYFGGITSQTEESEIDRVIALYSINNLVGSYEFVHDYGFAGFINNTIITNSVTNQDKLAYEIYSSTITNTYYMSTTIGNVYEEGEYNLLELTRYSSYSDIDFADDLGFDEDIWDLSGEIPKLK